MDFLSAAMRLIELNWHVFPISPGSKLPAVPAREGGKGVNDATIDRAQIEHWARRYPRANVGVACGRPSGISVIDVDPKNGGNETVAFRKSRQQLFTPTVLSRTPSGGWHLFYAFEPLLLNSKSLLGPGIDVRTRGGYIVAPPSVAGKPYVWIVAPTGESLPRMPRWALEALRPRPHAVPSRSGAAANAPGAVAGLVKFMMNAPSGQRNQMLFWAAARAAESGQGNDSTRAMLLDAAVACGLVASDGMRAANATISSGFSGKPRSR